MGLVDTALNQVAPPGLKASKTTKPSGPPKAFGVGGVGRRGAAEKAGLGTHLLGSQVQSSGTQPRSTCAPL